MRTSFPLLRQYPVWGFATCVGEQLPEDRLALDNQVIDAGNAKRRTVQRELLVVELLDVEYPLLLEIHPLTVFNLDHTICDQ